MNAAILVAAMNRVTGSDRTIESATAAATKLADERCWVALQSAS